MLGLPGPFGPGPLGPGDPPGREKPLGYPPPGALALGFEVVPGINGLFGRG